MRASKKDVLSQTWKILPVEDVGDVAVGSRPYDDINSISDVVMYLNQKHPKIEAEALPWNLLDASGKPQRKYSIAVQNPEALSAAFPGLKIEGMGATERVRAEKRPKREGRA